RARPDRCADESPPARGGCVRLSGAGPTRERAAALPRLRARDQLALRAAAVLQHADDELHDRRPPAHARESGIAALQLEGAAQWIRSAVCVRARSARHEPTLRRAPTAVASQ